MLLGLEYFYEFLLLNGERVQIQRVGEWLPLFVNTVFGWISAGKADLGSLNPVSCCPVTINTSILEEKIERFWTIEELQDAPRMTQEEQDCEEHLRNTFSRDTTGRYVVPTSAKADGIRADDRRVKGYGITKACAARTAAGHYPEFRRRYNEAMQAYLDQNHMRMVPEEELKCDKWIAGGYIARPSPR